MSYLNKYCRYLTNSNYHVLEEMRLKLNTLSANISVTVHCKKIKNKVYKITYNVLTLGGKIKGKNNSRKSR